MAFCRCFDGSADRLKVSFPAARALSSSTRACPTFRSTDLAFRHAQTSCCAERSTRRKKSHLGTSGERGSRQRFHPDLSVRRKPRMVPGCHEDCGMAEPAGRRIHQGR
jgi:hypothetical protein